MMRATMRGFIVLDYADRFEEAANYLAGLLTEGKLQAHDRDDRQRRHRPSPTALRQLFDGANVGKLLVRVSDWQVELRQLGAI